MTGIFLPACIVGRTLTQIFRFGDGAKAAASGMPRDAQSATPRVR